MDYEWLPVSDGQLLLWFNNFRQKVAQYSGALGLSTEELMQIDSEYKALAYMINQIQALRAEVQTRVDYKNLLRDGPEAMTTLPYPAGIILAERPDTMVYPGILPRIIRLVNRMKDSSGYTLAIGQDLGIEPSGVETVPTTPTGVIPVVDNGMARLEFVKGPWQGVIIESQRGEETQWQVLATTFAAPFVDARPPLVAGLAETRRYRLKYLDSVDAVGSYSDPVQVIMPAQQVPVGAAALR